MLKCLAVSGGGRWQQARRTHKVVLDNRQTVRDSGTDELLDPQGDGGFGSGRMRRVESPCRAAREMSQIASTAKKVLALAVLKMMVVQIGKESPLWRTGRRQ